MPQSLLVIGVIGFIAVVVVLSVVLSVQSSRKIAQFEQSCRDRGWEVTRGEGPGFGQQISGSTSGVGWHYEFARYTRGATNRGNRTAAQSAQLRVDSVNLPDDIVLLMPRNAQASQLGQTIQAMNQFGGLGHTLIELLVVQGLHGDQADVDRFLKLQPAQSGSDALRAQFSVLATSEDAAARVLGRSEPALLNFAGDPSLKTAQHAATVLLWSKGLTLPIERQITDVVQLEGLVNLVVALANSVKGW